MGISTLRADGPRATVTVVTSKNLARTGRTIHFFGKQVLQCCVVEHGVGQKLLQLDILALQSPQAIEIRTHSLFGGL